LLLTFPEVFSDKPGRCKLIEHEIRLRDESPCVQPRYRVPEKFKPQIEAELNKLLDGQFIRECHNSKYMLNLFVVYKKNGSIRLCV